MKPAFEKLAILIPTRNRPGILSTSLDEFRKAGMEGIPLWVYDDFSTEPEAIAKTVKAWPNVNVIRGNKRVGQAEGRNVLMRACGKEFALLLDDDSFPVGIAALEKHLSGSHITNRAIITCQYMDVPSKRYSTPLGASEGESASFQGGGSLFHVPTVLGLGGFRSFFIYGYEEPELSMRLYLNGFHIWYDPEFVVHHNHFETPNECRDYAEYDYLYARNSILMSSLNMPVWMGLPHGLVRSLRRSFFRKRNFMPKLRGTADGLMDTFSFWNERKPCSLGKALEWSRVSRAYVR